MTAVTAPACGGGGGGRAGLGRCHGAGATTHTHARAHAPRAAALPRVVVEHALQCRLPRVEVLHQRSRVRHLPAVAIGGAAAPTVHGAATAMCTTTAMCTATAVAHIHNATFLLPTAMCTATTSTSTTPTAAAVGGRGRRRMRHLRRRSIACHHHHRPRVLQRTRQRGVIRTTTAAGVRRAA